MEQFLSKTTMGMMFFLSEEINYMPLNTIIVITALLN